MKKIPCVFLDRDGVINADRDDYVKNTDELIVFPYAAKSIACLNDAGFTVIVISNQQGVAKGLIKESGLMAIQNEISGQVKIAGGKITAFYYCRHFASDDCGCRKPDPGMLEKAAKDHNIDLENSYMVGDTWKDISAGKAVGCKAIAVLSGMLAEEDIAKLETGPDFVARDLAEAVEYICRNKCT